MMAISWRSHLKQFIWVHGTSVLVVTAAVAAAILSPDLYERAMQEDRFAEWLTAVLFAAAGAWRIRAAFRDRRPFDLLVGIFCIFVAGEEMSWGQRLLGYNPPSLFLEHNTQQEATLHNFGNVIGKPKWSLIAVMAGFGILLPLAGRIRWSRKVVEFVRATPPSLSLIPWFALAVTLLVWYPLTYTGEWVELIAAILFLGSAVTSRRFAVGLLTGSVLALALTFISANQSEGVEGVACAQAETRALVADLSRDAASPEVYGAQSYERRLWTASRDHEVFPARMKTFTSVACTAGIPVQRRQYLVDPWGTSYWLQVEEREDGLSTLGVYSFGPNRRRDVGTPTSDDVISSTTISPFRD